MTKILYLSDPRFGLTKPQQKLFAKHGLIGARQVEQLAQTDASLLEKALGKGGRALVGQVIDALPAQPVLSRYRMQLPVSGVTVEDDLTDGALVGGASAEQITAHLETLGPAPVRLSLSPWMGPVKDQGRIGSCTGQSAAYLRGFAAETPISGEHIYKETKAIDPWPDQEGSQLCYALESCFKIGSVPSSAYTVDDLTQRKCTQYLRGVAAHLRMHGAASLMQGLPDRRLLPRLIDAVNEGTLLPGIGPRPVAVSTLIFPSMMTDFAYDTGLLNLPLPGETPCGAHAWTVCGRIGGDHPDAPGGRSYMEMINSWSTRWAEFNPLGLPGHGLLPVEFFTLDPTWVRQAYFMLAEPTPAAVTPVAA